jgi:hypothetical protein
MNDRPRTWVLAAFAAYVVVAKLIPYLVTWHPESMTYPWNFSPLPAFCLFGGAFFQDKRWSFGLPMVAWLIGDFGIWAITGHAEWAFYPDQVFVYGSMALVVAIGFALRERRSWQAVAGAGVLASVMFYVVTNFGLWAMGDGTRYAKDLSGLLDCYVRGIPFFRNYLIGTLAYSAVLFSPIGFAQFRGSEPRFAAESESVATTK